MYSGVIFASLRPYCAIVYRPLKRRMGSHLGDSNSKRVWSPTESHINFLELKAVFLKGFEHLCRDQIVLVATDNTTVVSYINKEGGMKSGSLCALLWRLQSWCHPRGIVLEGTACPRLLECNSGQIIQTQTSDSDRMVPISAGVRSLVLLMGTAGPFCDPVQPQTSQICVTGTRSNSLGSRHLEHLMAEPGSFLSTSLATQQGCIQSDRSELLQNDSDCTGVAQHALVLGPGQSVGADSTHAPTAVGSCDTAFQWASSRRSQEPESTCVAPRASVIQNKDSLKKWQQELRLLRGSQPELSISQSGPFLSNGVSQTRWTSGRPL